MIGVHPKLKKLFITVMEETDDEFLRFYYTQRDAKMAEKDSKTSVKRKK